MLYKGKAIYFIIKKKDNFNTAVVYLGAGIDFSESYGQLYRLR